MYRKLRTVAYFVACSFFCVTACAQVVIEKDYQFSAVNGKALPIPGGLPLTCQGGIFSSSWPFAAFALGGIYLPHQDFLTSNPSQVTISGRDTMVQASFGNYCVETGVQYYVTFYICDGVAPCPRPKHKFTIRTKVVSIGVRG